MDKDFIHDRIRDIRQGISEVRGTLAFMENDLKRLEEEVGL